MIWHKVTPRGEVYSRSLDQTGAEIAFLLSYIEIAIALLELERITPNSEDAAKYHAAALRAHATIAYWLLFSTLESEGRARVEQKLWLLGEMLGLPPSN